MSRTARHPLAVFLALTFGTGWPLLAVPVLASHGLIPGGPMPIELFALAVTWLVMLPAALWVTAAAEGRNGVLRLLASAVHWRFGAHWWAVVVLALPVTTVALVMASGGSFNTTDVVSISVSALVMSLIAVLAIHLWEETVWTGFVQKRLEHRYNLIMAALLTAVPFAGIHLPLLLIGDVTWPSLLADVTGLVCLAVAFRLLVGVCFRVTADSVFAIAVLHAAFNASNNEGALVDGLVDGSTHNGIAFVSMLLVTAAAAAALRTRTRTQRGPEACPAPPVAELDAHRSRVSACSLSGQP